MHSASGLPFFKKSLPDRAEVAHVWRYGHDAEEARFGMLVIGVTQQEFMQDHGLLGVSDELGPRRYRHMARPALEGVLTPLSAEEHARFQVQQLADTNTQTIPRAA